MGLSNRSQAHKAAIISRRINDVRKLTKHSQRGGQIAGLHSVDHSNLMSPSGLCFNTVREILSRVGTTRSL